MKDKPDKVTESKYHLYFQESLLWYNSKYLRPIYQNSLYLILNIITIILLFVLMMTIITLLPITKDVEYIIQTKNNQKGTIRYLNNNKYSYTQQVAKILLENYVINMEQYDYDNLQQQFEYIFLNSNQNVYNIFKENMSLKNPNSLINLLKNNYKQEITLLDYQMINNNEVIITFKKEIIGNNITKYENKIYNAYIKYWISNIEKHKENKTNFQVLNYKSSLLQSKN